MCTVTYIPTDNGFFFTSNRDEKQVRLRATYPQWFQYASGKILFPKDGNAGGTWMALHENGNAMVLLNGASTNHIYNPPYRKSRGLIFLDIFDHPNPIAAFEQIHLQGIEPFTLIIREKHLLADVKWDGHEKTIAELDLQQPAIWSSATLYADDIIKKRQHWFQQFVTNHTVLHTDNILNFHRFAGDGDSANDVMMNRENEYLTVSITSLEQKNNISKLLYVDLLSNETVVQEANHTMPVSVVHESA
ncbi:MAG: NRDE family protein [Chitinophagaceae bacterium]|jgi:hypothetical protein|nr:NRDE family protein [Chitinophagaceae bacterium]